MLNYDLSKIHDFKNLCYEKVGDPDPDTGEPRFRINPVTEALIMKLGLNIGIPSITENNHEEVFVRIHMFEQCFGASLSTWDDDEGRQYRNLSLEDVKAHIGLSTNGRRETINQYVKFLGEQLRRDARQSLRQSSSSSKSPLARDCALDAAR